MSMPNIMRGVELDAAARRVCRGIPAKEGRDAHVREVVRGAVTRVGEGVKAMVGVLMCCLWWERDGAALMRRWGGVVLLVGFEVENLSFEELVCISQ